MLEKVEEDDNKRELVKFNYWQTDKQMSLLEEEDNDEPFDQFKGKQTNYNWELYSTKLPPESSMTHDQIKFAEQLEQELFDDKDQHTEDNEELKFSAVTRSPQKQFKSTLLHALGGNEKLQSSAQKSNVSDPRSRTNSLRTGETSKIIQTIDLECSTIGKEDY